MNRRDFFKSAAALAAVAGISGQKAMAQAKPKAGNNQIWLMTSAFPGDRGFDDVVARAKAVGAQGLEVCVFRRDSDRKDHVATHLNYETFDLEAAKKVIETCNREGIRISVGSYDNLIGGDPAQQIKNQNHILKLIRIAALLGGDVNDVVCGTFVGYDH
ncbi:MAG: twin-arginine translocation signal domain-containing protein, partial [Kiritimatiellae bacterium]|nr:twin-arginine translocation signal domain-containing protein [Kiritimatiellia bacterium]